MKRFTYILLPLASLLIIACGERSDFDNRIAMLDSVKNANPDSIYAVLCTMHKEANEQPRASRMYYELVKADAQNKAYINFTTAKAMNDVTEYYEHHGSYNDRMRANYLLGCVYRDMDDAPRELQYLQNAIEQADTSRKDCDLFTLAAIYGQMAELFNSQYLPHEELDALRLLGEVASKDGDTLTTIAAYELRARAYFFMNMPDSVLSITDNARRAYLKHGYRQRAASTLGASISILIDRGEYDKATEYMNELERFSGYFDKHGNIIDSNNIIIFHDKGRIALHNNQLDSAMFYFSRLMPKEKESAYDGLLSLYEKTGQADSVMKYSRLYAAANDSSFLGNNAKTVERMTAMYNYNHYKRIAEQSRKDAESARKKSIAYVITFAVVTVMLAIFIYLMKRRKDKRIMEMTNLYYDILSTKEQVEKDIDNLKNESQKKESELKEQILGINAKLSAKYMSETFLMEQKNESTNIIETLNKDIETIRKQNKILLLQKEKELHKLQYQVDYYSGKLDLDDFENNINAFKNTEIFKKINTSIHFKDAYMKMTESDWKKFATTYKRFFPNYYKVITTNTQLNKDEKYVCLLLIFDFSTKQIAHIMNKSLQRISNIRASINKKLFNVDSAMTLNEHLRRLY